ncbi:MAG: SDR family oxidoreductase [Pseudomonadota bacterium]
MPGDEGKPLSVPKTHADLAAHQTVFAAGVLANYTVVVSGGGSGIGRATAWLAARLGAQVIVTGRSESKLVDVCSEITDLGLACDYRTLDIRDIEQVDTVLADIDKAHNGFDLLVNSAGGQFPQAAIDFEKKGWDVVVNTNLNGTWHMMQAAAQLWRERQTPGSIVNIVVVSQGLFGVAHTIAARAGVIAFSERVAVEWAPYSIRANCIAPGAIETEGWAVYPELARQRYPRTNPTMRQGSPWEIAEAIVFVGGPAGRFINGATLVVDGGGQHWGEIWTTGKPEYFASATRLWDDAAEDEST